MIKNLILFFVLLLCVKAGYATPPSDMKIEYNQTSKVLKVSMVHVTTNPGDHFIRKIEVFKNGESVKVYHFARQPSAREVSLEIPLEAKEGDVIEVKAICNQAGSKTESLTVPSEDKSAESKHTQAQSSAQTANPAKTAAPQAGQKPAMNQTSKSSNTKY